MALIFLTTLVEIGKEEIDAGRPPLNGLVRNRRFPEEGFYKKYTEWFPNFKKKHIMNNEKFDQRLRTECSEYWRRIAEVPAS